MFFHSEPPFAVSSFFHIQFSNRFSNSIASLINHQKKMFRFTIEHELLDGTDVGLFCASIHNRISFSSFFLIDVNLSTECFIENKIKKK